MVNKSHIVFALAIYLILAGTIFSLKAQTNSSLELNGDACVSSDAMDIPNVNFTIELWAFRQDWSFGEKQVLISYGKQSTSWRLFGNENLVSLELQTSKGVVVLEHPLLEMSSGWHHFAFSCDGRYIRFYVDGSQRDYVYYADGITVSSSNLGQLKFGCELDAIGEVDDAFVGLLDEIRVWQEYRSAQEIASAMHLDLMYTDSITRRNLLVCYPFYADSLFSSYNDLKHSSYPLIRYENVVISDSEAPTSRLKDDYLYDTQGYWALYPARIYSESSGGMHLAIMAQNQMELDEFDVFGHNGNMGITDDVLVPDLDFQSRREWYYDAHHDFESLVFRFDLSDAEAIGLLNACLHYDNYKLLYKSKKTDRFKIIASAYMLDGDNLYFNNIEGKDGYYALGRDNAVPMVLTKHLENVGSDLAFGGGDVVCDGGAEVTQRGLCWSLESGADLADSITMDGDGSGTFDSKLTNLVPGYAYYVRSYAINSEGIGYGDEIIIYTKKLNQSLVFPQIDPQVFGVAPFDPGAYVSSGLPITYRSTDTLVATIKDGLISVVGVGQTIIWAIQAGNASYNATSYRKAVLNVSKAEQTIVGMENRTMYYGDTLNLASIVASSGLVPRIALSDSSLFEFTDSGIYAKQLGVVSLFAVQEGDDRYLASEEMWCEISIDKKNVGLCLSDDTIVYSGVARDLSVSCDQKGLKMLVTYNQENSVPVSAGRYKVMAMVDDEFFQGIDSGVITILKATSPVVVWPELVDIFESESLTMSDLIGGEAGINGSFHIMDKGYVPSYSGEMIEVLFVPNDTVNYKTSKGFAPIYFNVLTTIGRETENAFKVWPTVSSGVINVKTERAMSLGIYDLLGRHIENIDIEIGLSEISLGHLRSGRYFLREITPRGWNEVKGVIIN